MEIVKRIIYFNLFFILISCNNNNSFSGLYKNEEGVSIELLDDGNYIITNNGLTIKSQDVCKNEKGYDFNTDGMVWMDLNDKLLLKSLVEAGMDLSDSTKFRFGKFHFNDSESKWFLVSGGVLYFKGGVGVYKRE